MIVLYNVLFSLIQPFLVILLWWRLKNGLEEKGRINERYGYSSLTRPAGKLLWFHASSVGETISVLSLINECLAKNTNIHILLTTNTTAAAKIILQRKLGARVIHQYVPLDNKAWVKRFLDFWHPSKLILVESELWPNLILQSSLRKITVILVNARLSAKSFAKWQKCSFIIKKILPHISCIYAQSDLVAQQFIHLGAKKLEMLGNLKFAAEALPYDKQQLDLLQPHFAKFNCWTAASVHVEEIEQILTIHKSLKQDINNLLTVVVLRHPQRIKEVEEILKKASIPYQLRSQNVIPNAGVYLVDTTGELGLFYRLIKIVFIGKTLAAKGGHNPIEPAILGCAVLWGPNMDNFQQVTEILSPVCFPCNDLDSVAKKVLSLLQSCEMTETAGLKAQALATAQKNNILHEIRQHLLVDL